ADATVASGTVTVISFAIDRLSTLNVKSSDSMCSSTPNVNFTIMGTKLIGADPDITKIVTSSITDVNGMTTFSSLEWDSYTATSTSYLKGTVPLMPFDVPPNTITSLGLITAPANSSALLMNVE